MHAVLIVTAWVVLLWTLGAFAAGQIMERYETEIVTSLRLHFGRAHTAEDWQQIKAWAILFGPATLVAFGLDWLIHNTGP